MTNIIAIRKLPELQEQQEWACEGGCDHIRPKHHESVYSEAWGHSGLERKSEFYYTCQNGHLLQVWHDSDYVTLADEFYKEEEPTIVKTESLEETINVLFGEIDALKDQISESVCASNDDEELLESLITKATQFGALTEHRDNKNITAVNPWVKTLDCMPELLKPQNDQAVFISEQVFFKLKKDNAIYHGFYVSQPKNSDSNEQECIYITSYFNSIDGNKAFSEDSVECWMYCPSYEGSA